jgi:hypothetical protein
VSRRAKSRGLSAGFDHLFGSLPLGSSDLVRIAESSHLHTAVTEISVQGTGIVEMTRGHTRCRDKLSFE